MRQLVRSSEPLRPGLALAGLTMLHAVAAAAAVWQAGQRIAGASGPGGVFAPDFVPLGSPLPQAVALAVAYAVTTYHLFRRSVVGIVLTATIAAAQLVLARLGDRSGAAQWLVLAVAAYVVVVNVTPRRFVRRSPRRG